jgi:hypothetical protein
MNEDYVKGFMAKAAELGVDPEELVKSALGTTAVKLMSKLPTAVLRGAKKAQRLGARGARSKLPSKLFPAGHAPAPPQRGIAQVRIRL